MPQWRCALSRRLPFAVRLLPFAVRLLLLPAHTDVLTHDCVLLGSSRVIGALDWSKKGAMPRSTLATVTLASTPAPAVTAAAFPPPPPPISRGKPANLGPLNGAAAPERGVTAPGALDLGGLLPTALRRNVSAPMEETQPLLNDTAAVPVPTRTRAPVAGAGGGAFRRDLLDWIRADKRFAECVNWCVHSQP